MTAGAPPHLVVAGYPYPEKDTLGRLPLRAFTVDRLKLQKATAERMNHPLEHLNFRWHLRFNSYNPAVRKAGAFAKKVWVNRMKAHLSQSIVPLRPARVSYAYSYLSADSRWHHRFKVTSRPYKATMDGPFHWNALVSASLGESVLGIFQARCPHCDDSLELTACLYVDTGSFAKESP